MRRLLLLINFPFWINYRFCLCVKKREFRLRLTALILPKSMPVFLCLIIILFFFTMPQFDIFSFLSQLFWVFLSFLLFYLLVCFYLLPAIAAILKTRKRKLAQISSNIDSTLTVSTQFSTVVKTVLDNINAKLSSLINLNGNPTASANINKSLSAFLAVELPSNLLFNTSIFKQSQISYLLYV